MTQLLNPAKATMRQLDPAGEPIDGSAITVQFNPETLKVSYSNQIVSQRTPASENSGNSASQATGGAKTTLAIELWFDATAPLPEGLTFYSEGSQTAVPQDVRRLTKRVSDFLRPPEGQREPLVVRFQWGTLIFDGLIESIEENLEFFSPQGVPLRASVSFTMTQQSLNMSFGDLEQDNVAGSSTAASGLPTGTQPTALTQSGDTMQSVLQRENIPRDRLKAVARQNGIENLRHLPAGQRLDMGARLGQQAQRVAQRTQSNWRDFTSERNAERLPATPEFPSLPPGSPDTT